MQHAVIQSYALPGGANIVRMPQRKNKDGTAGQTLWSVNQFGSCLNHEGEWEDEPSPSNRDEAFLARCRFSSHEEAYAHWAQLPESKSLMGAIASEQVPEATPAPKPHYTVIAHRWGWLNAHFYQVGQTADRDRAIELADEEASDRGGKYGVAVHEWANDTDHKRIHYAPSSYLETEPHTNSRIEMFSTIGHRAHDAALSGTALLPTPESEGMVFLKPVPAEVPDWLDQVVRHAERNCRFSDLLNARMKQQMKDGTFRQHQPGDPIVSAETQAWIDAVLPEIDAQVEGLMARRKAAPTANVAAPSDKPQENAQ